VAEHARFVVGTQLNIAQFSRHYDHIGRFSRMRPVILVPPLAGRGSSQSRILFFDADPAASKKGLFAFDELLPSYLLRLRHLPSFIIQLI
jgi:hypothetical protein